MNADVQRRSGPRFSKDGLTVIVPLRVERRVYEYVRQWAEFHAPAGPRGVTEELLEAFLSTALETVIRDEDWRAPREIEALYEQAAA